MSCILYFSLFYIHHKKINECKIRKSICIETIKKKNNRIQILIFIYKKFVKSSLMYYLKSIYADELGFNNHFFDNIFFIKYIVTLCKYLFCYTFYIIICYCFFCPFMETIFFAINFSFLFNVSSFLFNIASTILIYFVLSEYPLIYHFENGVSDVLGNFLFSLF